MYFGSAERVGGRGTAREREREEEVVWFPRSQALLAWQICPPAGTDSCGDSPPPNPIPRLALESPCMDCVTPPLSVSHHCSSLLTPSFSTQLALNLISKPCYITHKNIQHKETLSSHSMLKNLEWSFRTFVFICIWHSHSVQFLHLMYPWDLLQLSGAVWWWYCCISQWLIFYFWGPWGKF